MSRRITYPEFVSLRACLAANGVSVDEVSRFVEHKIKKKLCNVTVKEANDLKDYIWSGEYEKWKNSKQNTQRSDTDHGKPGGTK